MYASTIKEKSFVISIQQELISESNSNVSFVSNIVLKLLTRIGEVNGWM